MFPGRSKHLTREHAEEEHQQYEILEIIGCRLAICTQCKETANERSRAARHTESFKAAFPGSLDHLKIFPEARHTERADQEKEDRLVSGKNDKKRDSPHCCRADQSPDKSTHRREMAETATRNRRHQESAQLALDAADFQVESFDLFLQGEMTFGFSLTKAF